MIHEIPRTRQHFFFQIKPQEKNTPARFFGGLRKASGRFEHHGRARGVVVGTWKHGSGKLPQVIEMGAHDDPFVAELGVGPNNLRADITSKNAAGFDFQDVLAKRFPKRGFQAKAAKLVLDISGCAFTAWAAATGEFLRRQGRYVGANATDFRLDRPGRDGRDRKDHRHQTNREIADFHGCFRRPAPASLPFILTQAAKSGSSPGKNRAAANLEPVCAS